ncbi:Tim44/TimA family putative adaptor protein [Ancylobacter sp. 6x-1]|uniref:Tim44/TimA family putative adaptor protein n=1 Tax=Ancylobacter crimeensis TaxID=2579147 RepID=A0ABT0DC07_9HYPH|nr:Tim44/TimA family putative adaptor protein [Ancylobacter crimeensis]
MFDIYTIIFLALAVFIFIRLRSVLGQRTGRERPPYDPYSRRDATKAPAPGEQPGKVVSFPGAGDAARPRDPEPDPAEPAPPAPRWSGIADIGSAVANGLDAIAAQDRTFDGRHFVEGARAAYEMIVNAFAAGDRRILKDLLAKDVYDGFAGAMAEREARGETMETHLVAIAKSDLIDAQVKGRTAQVAVRFVSQLISVTRNASGEVVEGDPEKVGDVTDVWTFSRDLGARDPNWKLVATEAAS